MNQLTQEIQSSGYAIKLEIFEGPLDLLLHLIRKNRMNIQEISISQITSQYMEYLDLMEKLDLDIASDFILMAATLMQMKSKKALPSPTDDEIPDAEQLAIQLIEYEELKSSAQVLSRQANQQAKRHHRSVAVSEKSEFEVRETLSELTTAFEEVSGKMALSIDDDSSHDEENYEDYYYENFHHEVAVEEEITPIEEKMKSIENMLGDEPILFVDLFSGAESRLEKVVTFLAVLELIRLQQVIARQSEHFAELFLVANNF